MKHFYLFLAATICSVTMTFATAPIVTTTCFEYDFSEPIEGNPNVTELSHHSSITHAYADGVLTITVPPGMWAGVGDYLYRLSFAGDGLSLRSVDHKKIQIRFSLDATGSNQSIGLRCYDETDWEPYFTHDFIIPAMDGSPCDVTVDISDAYNTDSAMRLFAFNNNRNNATEAWPAGVLKLSYIKIGDYILTPISIPVKQGEVITPINLVEHVKGARGIAVQSYSLPQALPAGLELTDGIISGTPEEDIAGTSAPIVISYKSRDYYNESTTEYIYFTPKLISGIATAQADDPVVAEKYYTLTAVSVEKHRDASLQPGIYIVKQTLQSGATKTVKILVK